MSFNEQRKKEKEKKKEEGETELSLLEFSRFFGSFRSIDKGSVLDN
jgi:hypothetical protein